MAERVDGAVVGNFVLTEEENRIAGWGSKELYITIKGSNQGSDCFRLCQMRQNRHLTVLEILKNLTPLIR